MEFGNYLYFKTEAEYDKKVNSNQYMQGFISKPKNFPAYFRYTYSWDPLRDFWKECQCEEVISYLNQQIDDHRRKLEKLENLLNEIKKKI